MAYKKQTWEDRVVEKPMTYMMTTNEDGTVTLTPVPGTITNEGSKVNAERMNHIEQGIYDAAISGGSDVVFIGDTEPTNEQTKLWVEDDMLNSLGTEVINSLDGNETNLAPSVNAVNSAINAINNNINNIIESGSNENGSYIKFADGTMIQYKALVITTANQATTNVELPIDYLNSGFTILVSSLNYHSSNINYSSNSTSKNTFKVIATDNATGATPTSAEAFSYVTIGRWK